MSNRTTLVRGGLRAITGLAIIAVGALVVTTLGATPMPEVTRTVPEFSVNTAGTSSNTIVCQGSFGVLGVNASSPNDVAPIGSPATELTRDDAQGAPMAQPIAGGTPAVAYTVPGTERLRGAQSQRVAETSVKGMAATSCGEATSEQWLVGGSTVRGTSSIITLSNPGKVPATVTLSVYDESGPVEGIGTTGVLVPAGSQKTMPLNSFGAGRESTAVRVQASGSPVFATLGIHQITDITPIGADSANAQYGPDTQLVFAGVKTFEQHTHAGEEGGDDHVMVEVRLLSPEIDTEAEIFGLTADGERIALSHVALEAGAVRDTGIAQLPNHVTAIVVESDDPVVGGVKALVHNTNDYDFMWMTPSTVFTDEAIEVVTLGGGQLTLVNLSEDEAELNVGEQTIMFPGNSAKNVTAAEVATVTGSAPFALGVTLFDELSVSSYPVLGGTQQIEEFTVFTR